MATMVPSPWYQSTYRAFKEYGQMNKIQYPHNNKIMQFKIIIPTI